MLYLYNVHSPIIAYIIIMVYLSTLLISNIYNHYDRI